MTRRIINKAYSDLVGGAVNDPVGMSADVRKHGSMLRLTSNDLRYNSKPAETRTFDRQGRKTPQQTDRVSDTNPEEKRGMSDFIDIDGEGSATGTEERVQEQDVIPPTAYRMKSFMSSLDFGLRTNPQTPPKPHLTREPSKTLHQEDPHRDSKMFLPKGINQTNQPYVVPKFMPTYRDMMQAKVKPDPLVSIVETTPPSMQKWAIEWNNEPKRAISIDELKEDLLREANERALKESRRNQWVHSNSNSIEKSEEVTEEENMDQNNIDGSAMTYQAHSNRLESPKPRIPEYERYQPWKYVPIPTSFNGTRAEQMVDPEQEQKTIGKSLAEWVPPKYNGSNKKLPHDPLAKPYSFREAIAKGAVLKIGSEAKTASQKLSMPKASDADVYLDTDQEKFHEWFRKRMSAAVQSAVQSNQAPINHVPHAVKTPRPTPINRIKPPIPPLPEDDDSGVPTGNHIRNISQNESWKDLEKLGMIPVEPRSRPADVPHTQREQSKSSFSNWLKLRGNHSVKTEPDAPVKKEERVTTREQVQNAMRFPWSVSYMLHKKASAPKKLQQSPKNVKKLPKAVPDDNRIKYAKMSMKKSNRSQTLKKGSSHIGQTSAETFDRRSIKSPQKNALDPVSVKRNPVKKVPRRELSTAAVATNHIGFNDWSNELDHINNMRRTEPYAHTCRGSNTKKPLSSLGGTQMKYWETKYSKKSVFPQIQRASHTNSSVRASPYSWFTSIKELNDDEKGDEPARAAFSAIDERAIFPLTLPQYSEDEVVDLTKDMFNLDDQGEADGPEKAPDEQGIEQMKGKEDLDDADSLIQRVKQKLEDDECVLAFGQDAGEEDMEWSEFIGPKNNYDQDDDLATLISGKVGSVHSRI